MEKYVEIFEKIIRLLNKINQSNKIPRDYGTGHILHQSEIHTIEAIKNHENVNASELSSILAITNGALTQVVSKLKKKGLVDQYNTISNKKDVYYHLTDKGEIANLGHCKHHNESYKNLNQYIESLEDDKIEIINTFLEKLINNWPHN
ncbi:MarR family winged helix-turn-helix transcriptional regulator [Clostridium estertheticum]|uniref:MarR family winged helix-turn-helix transcriptional regulator n=1 Tax=Clostridium estertheticum TaxID=238834 RepID=UPI001CF1DB00|nr:MarR family transcriptional regulator [Clostridium estertheticum]MCB2356507.1 MarR family transcriptional regulator [Clostridium estertheticum]WAG43808.1 MarR family transcriptional regulator [Clostridium estertheticum]